MMRTRRRLCEVIRTPRLANSFKRDARVIIAFSLDRPSCDSVARYALAPDILAPSSIHSMNGESTVCGNLHFIVKNNLHMPPGAVDTFEASHRFVAEPAHPTSSSCS